MKNSDVPQRNTISNEVYINLDVFGVLMLHGVCGHVDNTHIVTEDNGGARKWSMKVL
jgi:hypothetical protein